MNRVATQTQRGGIKRAGWLVLGGLIGSMLVYLLDPVQGRRRRSLVRDRFHSVRKTVSRAGGRKLREIGHQIQGLVAEVNPRHNQPDIVDDHTLIDRVRSRLGRVVRHSRSIHVDAENGVITLSGPVLKSEVERLLMIVERTRGVRGVVHRLDVRATADGVPGLQGQGKVYLN